MKSIYKFGYTIDDKPEDWVKTINEIFSMNIKLDNTYLENCNNLQQKKSKEKLWLDMTTSLNFSKKIELDGLQILKIVPKFNRYQGYVYFLLLINGDVSYRSSSKTLFKCFRDRLKSILKSYKFVDNFKIPFKEPDFLEDYEEQYKYSEYIYLMNPTLVLDADEKYENEELKKLENKDFNLYYNYKYNNDGFLDEDEEKEKYMRVFEQKYILKEKHSIDSIMNHFHSIFVIFHRSECFYKELKRMDTQLELITLISNKLNQMWPRERLELLLINRFWNMGIYNQTFFSVLELNSQINSILNNIKTEKSKLEEKYRKQYERVLHNFKEDELEKNIYYKNLMKNMYMPLSHRTKLICDIETFFQPTDAQVDKLRGNNDSKVNFAIQWIMSILSSIIFIWGIVIVVYENTINIEKCITDNFLFGIGYAPFYLIFIIGLVMLTVTYMISKFIVRNSHDLSKETRKIISNKTLTFYDVENQMRLIENKSKYKLYIVVNILTMITTYMIIAPEKIVNDKDELKSNNNKDDITRVYHVRTIIKELDIKNE